MRVSGSSLDLVKGHTGPAAGTLYQCPVMFEQPNLLYMVLWYDCKNGSLRWTTD